MQEFDKMHILQVLAKTFECQLFGEIPTKPLFAKTTIILQRF